MPEIRRYRGYDILDSFDTIKGHTIRIIFCGEIITEVQSLPEAHSIIDYWLYAY
jgi:hypothetical protein